MYCYLALIVRGFHLAGYKAIWERLTPDKMEHFDLIALLVTILGTSMLIGNC